MILFVELCPDSDENFLVWSYRSVNLKRVTHMNQQNMIGPQHSWKIIHPSGNKS